MKNTVLLLFLVCISVVLINCKKHHNSLPVIPLDSDTFAYRHFNYKIGSYWIYKDSLNGRIDCFYVRNNYFINEGSASAVYTYHFIDVAEQNIDKTNVADSAYWQYNFQGKKVIVDYFYGQNGYGWKNDITFNPLFLYPFIVGDNGSNFDTAKVLSVDSFQITGDSVYYQVAEVQQFIHMAASGGPGLTDIEDQFNVNDSIGIISMKLFHPLDGINHLWELQRYKVTKY